MTWTTLADIIAAACFLLGASLALVAAIGVLRLPDTLARMHSATKPQVVGLMFLLLGLSVRLHETSATVVLMLVLVFQLFSAPIATHLLARAAYRTGQAPVDTLEIDDLTPALADDQEPRGAP